MKKVLSIMLCAAMVLAMAACIKVEPLAPVSDITENVAETPKTDPEPVVETNPTKEPEPVVDTEPTQEPEPTQDPEPLVVNPDPVQDEIKFDFGGWEEGFAAAEDKDEFIGNWWEKVLEERIDEETAEKIQNDENVKAAFIAEIKAQMTEQMKSLLASEGIEVDDSMNAFIESLIDSELDGMFD